MVFPVQTTAVRNYKETRTSRQYLITFSKVPRLDCVELHLIYISRVTLGEVMAYAYKLGT